MPLKVPVSPGVLALVGPVALLTAIILVILVLLTTTVSAAVPEPPQRQELQDLLQHRAHLRPTGETAATRVGYGSGGGSGAAPRSTVKWGVLPSIRSMRTDAAWRCSRRKSVTAHCSVAPSCSGRSVGHTTVGAFSWDCAPSCARLTATATDPQAAPRPCDPLADAGDGHSGGAAWRWDRWS